MNLFKKFGKTRTIIFILSLVALVVGVTGLILTSIGGEPKIEKFSLDVIEEKTDKFLDLSIEAYENKIKDKNSFLVFVDQDGCITADGLEQLSKRLMTEKSLGIYRMTYADVRKSSLFNNVKYYPSFVLVDSGKVVSWLKADSDEDITRYKIYEDFVSWLDKYIIWR